MINITLQPSLDTRTQSIEANRVGQPEKSLAVSTQYPDFGVPYTVSLSDQGRTANAKQNTATALTPATDSTTGTKKVDGTDCQTCKNRRYQDGSTDANVSFKTPGYIAPESSASVVAAHEQEHVKNAKNEGNELNKSLVSSTVRLYTAICPECGRTYTAGGETNTVMQTTQSKSSTEDTIRGKHVDVAA